MSTHTVYTREQVEVALLDALPTDEMNIWHHYVLKYVPGDQVEAAAERLLADGLAEVEGITMVRTEAGERAVRTWYALVNGEDVPERAERLMAWLAMRAGREAIEG